MRIESSIFARHAAGLAILLAAIAPASAQEATLLFGCQVMPGGGGIEVVFADSSAPIRTADGARLPASSLVGKRCPDAIGLLLDSDLIDREQLAASQHLVIHSERQANRDGDDTDIPDYIIWDIDSAEVTRMQLVCDPSGDNRIVVQESGATSGPVKNYLGWTCVDALADLGGLSNVVRTSVIRPAQAPIRTTRTPIRTRSAHRIPFQDGSIIFYQFALRLPSVLNSGDISL